jgi:hypothetical protein
MIHYRGDFTGSLFYALFNIINLKNNLFFSLQIYKTVFITANFLNIFNCGQKRERKRANYAFSLQSC